MWKRIKINICELSATQEAFFFFQLASTCSCNGKVNVASRQISGNNLLITQTKRLAGLKSGEKRQGTQSSYHENERKIRGMKKNLKYGYRLGVGRKEERNEK